MSSYSFFVLIGTLVALLALAEFSGPLASSLTSRRGNRRYLK